MIRPEDPSPLTRVLYGLGFSVFRISFTLLWRMKIVGRENILREGPALFASNHTSFADPPIVGCCIPRLLHFMAKQELFDVPVLGLMIRHVNAFPVKRWERDVSAFKNAQRVLVAGGAMIIFPEGTRQKTGALGRPKPGVGMLAVKSGVPVVPVYVRNSNRLWSFRRIEVTFGKALVAAPDGDYREFSARVMRAIADLKEAPHGSRR